MTFSRRAQRWVMLAAWFGLVTGLAEVMILLVRRFGMGRQIWTSVDLLWMAPLVYMIFFLAPAAIVIALSLLRPDAVTLPRATFLFGFLAAGVVSQVFFGGSIHVLGHALIAAGAGIQLARWSTRPGGGFTRTVHRSLPWLIAGVTIIAVGMPAGRRLLELRAVAGLPPATPGAKNVLLIIWDTVREQSLSLYGYPHPTTPNLDRWARQGAVFDRALTTAPWTLSSHASIFTGRLAQELSTGWLKNLDRTFPTLAEELSRRGYRTGGFVANLLATTRETGLARGFAHYEDQVLSVRAVFLSTLVGQRIRRFRPFNRGPLRVYPFKPAPAVTDGFLDWLDTGRDQPFFAFLNYFDAHDPYYPPPEWRRRFDTGAGRENRAQWLRDAYDAAIAYLDAELDRLLRELERRGVLDSTLVILTSDHGELFGEHGLFQHGNSLYLPLLHVPLVLRLPGEVPAGTRITHPVSLRDLPATVLALAAREESPLFPGRSWKALWQAGVEPARLPNDPLIAGVSKGIGTPLNEPVSRGSMNSVFLNRLHYILNGDGEEELYDVVSDPGELVTLVTDSLGRHLLPDFRAALRTNVPERWIQTLP